MLSVHKGTVKSKLSIRPKSVGGFDIKGELIHIWHNATTPFGIAYTFSDVNLNTDGTLYCEWDKTYHLKLQKTYHDGTDIRK